MGLSHRRGGGSNRPLSHRRAGAIVSGVVAIAVALFTGQAYAESGTSSLKSHLTRIPRAQAPAAATGSLSGRLKLAGSDSSFTWTLKFSHLSGRALHAGIYYGKAAKPAELAMLLCNKCISGAHSYYRGSYVASTRFVRAIFRGRAYVVIQTKRSPHGEIRGRIKVKS